jgi:hypothetical protein
MWSFTVLKVFNVTHKEAISMSSTQLSLMYSNYKNGKLNTQNNSGSNYQIALLPVGIFIYTTRRELKNEYEK